MEIAKRIVKRDASSSKKVGWIGWVGGGEYSSSMSSSEGTAKLQQKIKPDLLLLSYAGPRVPVGQVEDTRFSFSFLKSAKGMSSGSLIGQRCQGYIEPDGDKSQIHYSFRYPTIARILLGIGLAVWTIAWMIIIIEKMWWHALILPSLPLGTWLVHINERKELLAFLKSAVPTSVSFE